MTKKVKNSTKYVKCLKTLLAANFEGEKLDHFALLNDIKSIAEEYCIVKHEQALDLLIEASLLFLFGCKLFSMMNLVNGEFSDRFELSSYNKKRFEDQEALFEAATQEYITLIAALTDK